MVDKAIYWSSKSRFQSCQEVYVSRIDRSQINIQKKGFEFTPFRPNVSNEIPLKSANLEPDVELISFERKGERRTLIATEMHYHHVAQGELAGEPYLVTF